MNYDVSIGGPPSYDGIKVEVLNRQGFVVASSDKDKDNITIANANFWWPYTLNSQNPGYMYTLKVGHLTNMSM